jgi:CelD/BcsL family acetyltransferase involved in cellulose biosynthesis
MRYTSEAGSALAGGSRPAASPLSVEVAEGPLTPLLEREWDELARATGALPFSYPRWHAAWAQAFARGRLAVVTARRSGELVALAPAVGARGVLRASANWHTPRYGLVASDGAALAAVARFLVGRPRRRLDVTMLDARDPALAAVRSAADSAGRAAVARPVARQPYVDVSGDLDTYRASLPRKQRKELARLERRLRDLGDPALTVVDGGERLDAALSDGFRLEASGWKHKHGEPIASSAALRTFYGEVARWAAERGWLRLAFLEIDGRRVAFDYCIEAGGGLFVLKGGFDPGYRRVAPGVMLTWWMLGEAFDGDADSYELLGDADPYKLSWTDRAREVWRVQAFASGPLGAAERLAWSRGRPLAKRALAAAEADAS